MGLQWILLRETSYRHIWQLLRWKWAFFKSLNERRIGLSPERRHSNISALWMGFQWILPMVTREIRNGGSWKWWGHGDRFGLKKMITLQIEEDLLLQTISLVNWTIFTNLFSNSLVTHSRSLNPQNILISVVSAYLHKYLLLFCDWPFLLHHILPCSWPSSAGPVLLQFHKTGHFMIECKVTQNVFLAPHPTHSRPCSLDTKDYNQETSMKMS